MTDDERSVALSNALSLSDLIVELDQACQVTVPDACEALEGDPDALAMLLRQWRELGVHLRDATKCITRALIDSMPTKQYVVEGMGEIEWANAASRTQWQNDDVWAAVSRALMEQPALAYSVEGEMLDFPTIVQNVLREVRGVLSPSWKVGKAKPRKGENPGGLRGLGIDPDEFCNTDWERTVTLPRANDLVQS